MNLRQNVQIKKGEDKNFLSFYQDFYGATNFAKFSTKITHLKRYK